MSHEALVEQLKTLPEECIEEVSKYIAFLLYQYNLNKMNMDPLIETEEEFNTNMRKGLEDAKAGRVQPLDEAFAEIRRQFA